MKRAWLTGFALIAACAALGLQISDTVTAKRIGVYRDDGQPAVVASVDQLGNGEFVVFDNGGKEIFAVRGGAVQTPASVQPTNPPASPKPNAAPSVPHGFQRLEAEMRQRGVPAWLKVANPSWMDDNPRLAVAVLDYAVDMTAPARSGTYWRYALRVTNVGDELIEFVTVEISYTPYPDSGVTVRLTELPAGESTVLTKSLRQPDTAALSRHQLVHLDCQIVEYRARQ